MISDCSGSGSPPESQVRNADCLQKCTFSIFDLGQSGVRESKNISFFCLQAIDLIAGYDIMIVGGSFAHNALSKLKNNKMEAYNHD